MNWVKMNGGFCEFNDYFFVFGLMDAFNVIFR